MIFFDINKLIGRILSKNFIPTHFEVDAVFKQWKQGKDSYRNKNRVVEVAWSDDFKPTFNMFVNGFKYSTPKIHEALDFIRGKSNLGQEDLL